MGLRYAFLCGVLISVFCLSLPVGAISKAQEAAIRDNCESIRDDLKNVQKSDARARVYLGGRFESILNEYVVPLNMRLVENNLSTTGLIESQNTIASGKLKFANEYVEYQQRLEELVAMDCKSNPGEFYDKLTSMRRKRKRVEQDVQELRTAIGEYAKRVTKLKGDLNVEAK